jgi:hypothetical protein
MPGDRPGPTIIGTFCQALPQPGLRFPVARHHESTGKESSMNTTVIDRDRTAAFGTGRAGSEASLQVKDVAAFIMAAVMTLGPLAAAALFQ